MYKSNTVTYTINKFFSFYVAQLVERGISGFDSWSRQTLVVVTSPLTQAYGLEQV